MSAVTDVIVARSHAEEKLTAMVLWSVAAHVVVAGVLLTLPERGASDPPKVVMTISLGGAPGPKTGGITQVGGREVQALKPVEPQRRAESAPAAVRPKMTLPDPRASRRTQASPERAPTDAKSDKLSTGERVQTGSNPSETRVRGQGFGLSTSGGLGAGSVKLDVANFCCEEYLTQMTDQIRQNWAQNQGVPGMNVIVFVIKRDGTLEQIRVERPSGFLALDIASQRALLNTRRLQALPNAFPNPTLTVHLTFNYEH